MTDQPRTPMSKEMLADERFHGTACDRAAYCSCGMTQNLVYVETEAREQAAAEARRELLAKVEGLRAGTICQCGLARSYHGPNPPNLADHEYKPRMESGTWAEAMHAVRRLLEQP